MFDNDRYNFLYLLILGIVLTVCITAFQIVKQIYPDPPTTQQGVPQ